MFRQAVNLQPIFVNLLLVGLDVKCLIEWTGCVGKCTVALVEADFILALMPRIEALSVLTA